MYFCNCVVKVFVIQLEILLIVSSKYPNFVLLSEEFILLSYSCRFEYVIYSTRWILLFSFRKEEKKLVHTPLVDSIIKFKITRECLFVKNANQLRKKEMSLLTLINGTLR
uniref:Uncharacterized protein n=1 Tax=Opuntia streptacantha TaxID=393608 RepID=A0A7C9EWN3_OPUST